MVGTPLRVWAVPGKRHLAKFGQEIGAASLLFQPYYGLPLSWRQPDLIAIPDFASGAMENLGAITFRETALLVDEQPRRAANWNGWPTWSRMKMPTCGSAILSPCAGGTACGSTKRSPPSWKCSPWITVNQSGSAGPVLRCRAPRAAGRWSQKHPSDRVSGTSSRRSRGHVRCAHLRKRRRVLRMLEQYLGAEAFRAGISLYLRSTSLPIPRPPTCGMLSKNPPVSRPAP